MTPAPLILPSYSGMRFANCYTILEAGKEIERNRVWQEGPQRGKSC